MKLHAGHLIVAEAALTHMHEHGTIGEEWSIINPRPVVPTPEVEAIGRPYRITEWVCGPIADAHGTFMSFAYVSASAVDPYPPQGVEQAHGPTLP